MGLFSGDASFGDIAKPLFGAIAGKITSEKVNEANVAANKANIAAQAENQKRAIDALSLKGPFSSTIRDEDTGGFTSIQPGSESAVEARSELARGDVERAKRLNLAGNQFQPTLPDVGAATDLARRDIARQQGEFDKSIGDLIASRQRTGGGMANEPFHAATVNALQRAANKFNVGAETKGLDIYNKQRTADVQLLAAIQAANQPQAGFPAYSTGGPGATAANVIAQTPPRAVVPDISGAILPQAVGNVAQDIMRREQDRLDNQNFLKALESMRHLRDTRSL
jgi:hypothetical protein